MKKLSIILAALFLAGCSQNASESESSSAPEVTTTQSTSATAVTTTSVTTVTTTAATTSTTAATTTTTAVTTEKPPVITSVTQPPVSPLTPKNARIEVFSAATVADIVTSTANITNGSTRISTDVVGSCTASVAYSLNGKSFTEQIAYTVIDTTAPLVLNGGWGGVVIRGESFNLDKLVGYADNYDRSPSLSYAGAVDTSVCGEYPITATVTDSSGNKTSWDLKVKVLDKKPVQPDDLPRLPFADFAAEYADEGTLGIDVSKWQGNIDFAAVKAAGCEFVMMRIGHSRNGIEIDEYFKTNIAAAKAAGLKVGVYFYSVANTEAEVIDEAQWIVETLGGQSLNLPVAFDWESFSRFQQFKMSIYDLNRYFQAFAKQLESHGYSTMLYSSKNYLNNFWDKQTPYPVWLAHYISRTDYTGKYALWQMSCRGRIDGIGGDVDLNILYDSSILR